MILLLHVYSPNPRVDQANKCLEICGRFPPKLPSRIETMDTVADETMTQSSTVIGRVRYALVARMLGDADFDGSKEVEISMYQD